MDEPRQARVLALVAQLKIRVLLLRRDNAIAVHFASTGLKGALRAHRESQRAAPRRNMSTTLLRALDRIGADGKRCYDDTHRKLAALGAAVLSVDYETLSNVHSTFADVFAFVGYPAGSPREGLIVGEGWSVTISSETKLNKQPPSALIAEADLPALRHMLRNETGQMRHLMPCHLEDTCWRSTRTNRTATTALSHHSRGKSESADTA